MCLQCTAALVAILLARIKMGLKQGHGFCAVQRLFLTCTMQRGSPELQKAEKLAPSLLAAMPGLGRLADLCSRVTAQGT